MKKLEVHIKNNHLDNKNGTHLSEGLEAYMGKAIAGYKNAKCDVEDLGKYCILHVTIATRTDEVINTVSKSMSDSKLWDHEIHFNFYDLEEEEV